MSHIQKLNPVPRSKTRFEWYYFDVHCEASYDIVFTIHTHPFSSVFPVSIWDLFVYHRDQLLKHVFIPFPQKQVNIRTDPFQIWIDENNYYSQSDQKYIVRFKKDPIEIYLEFDQTGVERDKSRFNIFPDSKRIFDWKIFTPLSKASGYLKMNDETITISGQGYHDYNSGSFNPKNELDYWYWGKLYVGDDLYLLGQIIDQQKAEKRLALHFNGLSVKKMDWFRDGRSIRLKKDADEQSFTIEEEKLIDELFFLTNTWPPSFLTLAKIRELLTFASMQSGLTRPLNKLLANSRYIRRKAFGHSSANKPFKLFMEEMKFNNR